MRIIVFGNASLLESPIRLGVQIIAGALAARGHEVDYVGVPTHPLDFRSSYRRRSFVNAWLHGHDRAPMVVGERLREYFLKAPFSRVRKYWYLESQRHAYTMLAPGWVRRREYDVCIRDTSISGLFANLVRARVRILRLNDNPDGQMGHLHPCVIEDLRQRVRSGFYQEVWAASEPLVEYGRRLGAARRTRLVPNGVFADRYLPAATRTNRVRRSAVYVGAFNGWFDAPLLAGAAQRLGDWRFDVYGPSNPRLAPLSRLPNVRVMGPARFDELPDLLTRYRVGLVPFSGHPEMLLGLDPLKAYQYFAAGLGIASTSHGRLGTAFTGIARFGNDPESFATAVEVADDDCCRLLELAESKAALRRHDWNRIVDDVESRLYRLMPARVAA